MHIIKFGGTSVGTADRMNEVIDIIEKNPFDQIVVLSAMSGTTNDLVRICDAIKRNKIEEARILIERLEYKYVRVLTDLYPDKADRDIARKDLRPCFELIKTKIAKEHFDHSDQNEILAQGELISTRLFALICSIRRVNVALIPALDFMCTDDQGEPHLEQISERIEPFLNQLDEDLQILVTQGYICRNSRNQVDNLLRGGSDYTATILGAITQADEIQIWTDIDGVHNNDPRLVNNTEPIRNLSYREAAELAYFGAKILHPTCVLPAEKACIPLRLKYTMEPDAPGTLISNISSKRPVTALAGKDGITAINIYSHRMLNAYGFLTKVFQIFEEYKTSVDMITTSEVAVSLTIDNTARLPQIVEKLSTFSEVEFQDGYSIICIVGNSLYNGSEYVQRIFQFLKKVPIRMVSMGGSKNNISMLVEEHYKNQALISLHKIFEKDRVGEPVMS